LNRLRSIQRQQDDRPIRTVDDGFLERESIRVHVDPEKGDEQIQDGYDAEAYRHLTMN
jgi:hypothetical protein